jgi:hypothetical protein
MLPVAPPAAALGLGGHRDSSGAVTTCLVTAADDLYGRPPHLDSWTRRQPEPSRAVHGQRLPHDRVLDF